MDNEISEELALELLAFDNSNKRIKRDTTEPRIAATWFKQVVDLTHTCENPNCCDPRPMNDKGRMTTSNIKGKFMCRYCFIDGWLSEGFNVS